MSAQFSGGGGGGGVLAQQLTPQQQYQMLQHQQQQQLQQQRHMMYRQQMQTPQYAQRMAQQQHQQYQQQRGSIPMPYGLPGQQQQRQQQQQQQQLNYTGHMEDWYLDGGYRNRILLALESKLPNEVDWAFNKLIRLSFRCPDNFSLGIIPGVVDAIMEHAAPFMSRVEVARTSEMSHETETGTAVRYDLFQPPSNIVSSASTCLLDAATTERTLQIFHIFRNFSFIEPNIALLLHRDYAVLRLLVLGLVSGRLSGDGGSSVRVTPEIRRYSLDIVENLAAHIRLGGSAVTHSGDNSNKNNSNQDLYDELVRLVHSDDRALIVGALRTLTRLVMVEANEAAFVQVDGAMMQRLMQLIFVWDEELVAAIMDFLYQYSSLYDNVSVQLAQSVRANIVKVLLKFLAWKSHRRPVAAAAQAPPLPLQQQAQLLQQRMQQQQQLQQRQPSQYPPYLSQQQQQQQYMQQRMQQQAQMQMLQQQQQPRRVVDAHSADDVNVCVAWLRETFEKSSDTVMQQVQVYTRYHKYLAEYGRQPLSLPTFVQLISRVFRGVTTMTVQAAEAAHRPLIRGIRVKDQYQVGSMAVPPPPPPASLTASLAGSSSGTTADQNAAADGDDENGDNDINNDNNDSGSQEDGDNDDAESASDNAVDVDGDDDDNDNSQDDKADGEDNDGNEAAKDTESTKEQTTDGMDVDADASSSVPAVDSIEPAGKDEDKRDDSATPIQTEPEPELPAVLTQQCGWQECEHAFPADRSTDDILAHVKEGHIAAQAGGVCRWKTCQRFSEQAPARSAAALLAHFCTHAPYLPPVPTNSGNGISPERQQEPAAQQQASRPVTQQQQQPPPPQQHYQQPSSQQFAVPAPVPMTYHDTSSIPLTAALILRNLARAKDNVSLFAPYESEIASLAASANHHESVLKAAASILCEVAKADAQERPRAFRFA